MEEEFNLGSNAVELYGKRLKNVTLTDSNCITLKKASRDVKLVFVNSTSLKNKKKNFQ